MKHPNAHFYMSGTPVKYNAVKPVVEEFARRLSAKGISATLGRGPGFANELCLRFLFDAPVKGRNPRTKARYNISGCYLTFSQDLWREGEGTPFFQYSLMFTWRGGVTAYKCRTQKMPVPVRCLEYDTDPSAFAPWDNLAQLEDVRHGEVEAR